MSTDDALMSNDDALMSTDDVQARADLARARLRSVLGLQEAVHVHAGLGATSMHSVACIQVHAFSCMHSVACTQLHAFRCMHSDACTQMHALRCVHAGSRSTRMHLSGHRMPSDAISGPSTPVEQDRVHKHAALEEPRLHAMREAIRAHHQWPVHTCGAGSGPQTCSPGRASRRQMTGRRRRAVWRTRPER